MPEEYYTLITGASEGLGKFLALECAHRKMNLILVSLRRTGLPELSEFLVNNFGVEVAYFEYDLSETANCYELGSEIKKRNLHIRMLINNAGMGGTHAFEEKGPEFYEKQIRLNVLSTTLITRLLIENLERSTPAYILNVGSLASFFTVPNKQVYAGTKAYVYHFSKSLKNELSRSGITVSVLCPGGINTNLTLILCNRKLGWISRNSILNPEEVAAAAISGLLNGREVIIPGLINNLFIIIKNVIPSLIRNALIRRSTGHLRLNASRYSNLSIP